LLELAGEKEEYANSILAIDDSETKLGKAKDHSQEKAQRANITEEAVSTKPTEAYMLTKSP
jgi:hypothetical protein